MPCGIIGPHKITNLIHFNQTVDNSRSHGSPGHGSNDGSNEPKWGMLNAKRDAPDGHTADTGGDTLPGGVILCKSVFVITFSKIISRT